MKDLRSLLSQARRKLPPAVGGTAVNVGRMSALVFSRETLHTRDLGTLHETHLLVRRAEADRANDLVARYHRVAREYGQREELRSREARILSQNGEDGILLHLLSAVAVEPRHKALEIGAGGWSSNIANLVVHFGFDGMFVDGSASQLDEQRERLRAVAPGATSRATYIREWARPATFAADVRSWAGSDFDVLSLDVDSMDYWLLRSLDEPPARVIVAEYNASFGPTARLTVPPDDGFDRWSAHASGFYYGASLAAVDAALASTGYALVGSESSGVNAFFVREDILPNDLVRVSSADAYHPDIRRSDVPLAEQEALMRGLGAIEV